MLIAGMFPGDIEFKAQRGTLSRGAPSKMQGMDLYLEVEKWLRKGDLELEIE